jgi:glycosyltransferase involved in cell wall biosynthesis
VVDNPGAEAPVVRQRATIIVSTTARFHSRLYRIARGLVDRGHTVTVIARWEPGLPREEWHPAGYRIRRIDAGPLDGLPVIGGWRQRRRGSSTDAPAPRGSAPPAPPPAAKEAVPATAGQTSGPSTPPARRRSSRPMRAIKDAVAPFARSLTIRGLARAADRVAPPADLYHAVTYTRIPVGLHLGRRDGAKVVYDAADIYMDSGLLADVHRPGRWFLARSEREAARAADRVISVSDAYATVIAERFGVEYPLVVMNCSYRYTPPAEPEHRFHRVLGLGDDVRVVLYQGNFFPHRGIEQLVRAIVDVPRGVLVLMGEGPLDAELRAAAERPATAGRIRVMAPVSPEDLLPWVASADVVAVPIQPSTLNHRLTTPNKLFEAMAAGVPVVASDLPGMAPIVRDTGAGLLFDATDVGALAATINRIIDAPEEERQVYHDAALRAAHERYNWESQLEGLLDEYSRLTGSRW